MGSFDTYSARTTNVGYPWPPEVTGLERVILSAQADLQRSLSAFFARPITVSLVFAHSHTQEAPNSKLIPLSLLNAAAIASASPDTPIIQRRQVNLLCAGKVVCTATSTVRIASPECAHLFLEEKYAIGQVFRRLSKVPAFELLDVGAGTYPRTTETEAISTDDPDDKLWRKYKLAVPEFECEILELFPSREMFRRSEQWLLDIPST
ncbi:hypothetical protein AX15_003581 [Amanita polypyramis BW_CC]|nr:hypothetical protein AX15_003581 [Amanita polypyramis BW_CC]